MEEGIFIWGLSHAPWIWLFITIICILIESFTMALTTIWFACGAFAMVFLSLATPLPFRWQLLVFVLFSFVLLLCTRPLALKKLQARKISLNADSLIGKKVLVTESVTEMQKGAVKVNGVVWSARSTDGATIEAGRECTITAIEGATVIVRAEDKTVQ